MLSHFVARPPGAVDCTARTALQCDSVRRGELGCRLLASKLSIRLVSSKAAMVRHRLVIALAKCIRTSMQTACKSTVDVN